MKIPKLDSTRVLIVLSSALTGAFLNFATGLLDHPRAHAALTQLGPALAAGLVVMLALALAVDVGAGAAARRLKLAGGPLSFAAHLGLVLAVGVAPVVEAALRDADGARALVVLAGMGGSVLLASAVGYFLGQRPPKLKWLTGPAIALVAPLAALVCLAAVWVVEYHATGGALRVVTLVAGAVALRFCTRAPGRVPVVKVTAPLAAAVLALGGWGLFVQLRGTPKLVSSLPEDAPAPVVLITIDTLRTDRVLGDGPDRVETPAIDALADQSVVFTHARSSAPWTKPSLATVLTGLSPLVHGMTDRRATLPENIETLPERLARAGYRTGGVGLNVHLERAFRFDQGFDDYAFPARPDQGPSLGAKLLGLVAPARFPAVFPSTTAIADAALEWLDGNADEPFFLWVHVLDPHWPYEPPEEWLPRPEVQPRAWGKHDMVTNVQAGNTKPRLDERRRVAELYEGEIRYVDAQVGRILDRLHDLGLYDRSLIVLASDHGEEFWEHGRYEHGHTLYDEVLRVPLMFKPPGQTSGRVIDTAVSTESVTPTILDLVGVPFEPAHMSAPSLAEWRGIQKRPLFFAGTYYHGEKQGVLFDGKKLVLELDTMRAELYDLDEDPHELRSLAGGERKLRDEGLELMEQWQARCSLLRRTLGISDDSETEVSPEILRAMQALGYGGNE